MEIGPPLLFNLIRAEQPLITIRAEDEVGAFD